ncbi:MAG TPA: hypothetical protein VMW23_04010 [Sedimentisphaerales bacterium]|nr:hypothetical protein [Sedimentisphaerales bacterium]
MVFSGKAKVVQKRGPQGITTVKSKFKNSNSRHSDRLPVLADKSGTFEKTGIDGTSGNGRINGALLILAAVWGPINAGLPDYRR